MDHIVGDHHLRQAPPGLQGVNVVIDVRGSQVVLVVVGGSSPDQNPSLPSAKVPFDEKSRTVDGPGEREVAAVVDPVFQKVHSAPCTSRRLDVSGGVASNAPWRQKLKGSARVKVHPEQTVRSVGASGTAL